MPWYQALIVNIEMCLEYLMYTVLHEVVGLIQHILAMLHFLKDG